MKKTSHKKIWTLIEKLIATRQFLLDSIPLEEIHWSISTPTKKKCERLRHSINKLIEFKENKYGKGRPS